MIITIDTETQSLNAQRFLMGAIYSEKKHWEFTKKEEMYEKILELAVKEHKKGKKLTVYAHNLAYDYIAIGAHRDKRNVLFCPRPLIADHWRIIEGERRSIIKWIDTTGLFRGALKDIGKLIESPKSETPNWLTLHEYKPTQEEKDEAMKYCVQDCKVLYDYIQYLKRMVKEAGLTVPILYTAGQMSMHGFLKHLYEKEEKEPSSPNSGKHWLYSRKSRSLYRTRFPNHIHEAYRGGRVEAFYHGRINDAAQIDANSLYPGVSLTTPIPDLKTEQYMAEPLKKGAKIEYILEKEGVSQVLISFKQQDFGFLPIRQHDNDEEYTIYPTGNTDGDTYMIGAWTHLELRRAIELGYTIHDIGWSVTYSEGKNPFNGYFDKLYRQRLNANNKEESHFYKLMMNSLIGKLASRRPAKLVHTVKIDAVPLWTQEGWECIDHITDEDALIIKELGFDYRRYYAPIWAAYITAAARIFCYDALCTFGKGNVYYCDTDGFVCTPDKKILEKFKYGSALKEYKVVTRHAPANIWGKKAVRHGDEIKLSRIPKMWVDAESFDEGTIVYEDLIGIQQGDDESVGTPKQNVRDLTLQPEKEAERINHGRLLIDARTRPTEHQINILKTNT